MNEIFLKQAIKKLTHMLPDLKSMASRPENNESKDLAIKFVRESVEIYGKYRDMIHQQILKNEFSERVLIAEVLQNVPPLELAQYIFTLSPNSSGSRPPGKIEDRLYILNEDIEDYAEAFINGLNRLVGSK